MPASDYRSHVYRSQPPEAGAEAIGSFWRLTITLEICDLYRLKLVLAWDSQVESCRGRMGPATASREVRPLSARVWSISCASGISQAEAEDLRKSPAQPLSQAAAHPGTGSPLNGVGNPGALLYARFEREDAARRQIVHFYVPKWVSLGSSPQAGLRIEAEGVVPHHAELLVQGRHVLDSESGRAGFGAGRPPFFGHQRGARAWRRAMQLRIGTARFTFEGVLIQQGPGGGGLRQAPPRRAGRPAFRSGPAVTRRHTARRCR
jgi:hypothetical protein